MADFTIGEPTVADEADWRYNWGLYLKRYAVVVAPLTVDVLWARLLDPASSTKGLIARDSDGRGVGFCHLILHDNTWFLEPICQLSDMFVAPDFRRNGVGRAMLGTIMELAKARSWCRVYWTTWDSNVPARTLYDQLTGGPDPLVRYTYRVSA